MSAITMAVLPGQVDELLSTALPAHHQAGKCDGGSNRISVHSVSPPAKGVIRIPLPKLARISHTVAE